MNIRKVFFNQIKRKIDSAFTRSDVAPQADSDELLRIAKLHDVLHLMDGCLSEDYLQVKQDIASKISKAQMTAIYRHLTQENALEQVCALFEKEGIPFMPLKGSIIRAYYPEPWMRTSCDIDILVKEEDAERASEALCRSLAYTFEKRMTHDISLYSPAKVHLELHFRMGDDEKVSSIFSGVWEKASIKEGTQYHHIMDHDSFAAYHFAHMAEHFVHGGCGVRPFIDLWIMKHKMAYNVAIVREMLSQAKLDAFMEKAVALYEVWFEDAEHTPLTEEMESYIMQSGIYGTTENRVAIAQANKGGKLRYVLGRIFLPYSRLVLYYPALKRHPVLFPFYQMKRWLRIVFTKDRKYAMNELRHNASVSEDKQARLVGMCEELGLI